ncbi:hypothetical protein VPNG_09865 [Cytospora leucostoma]|uniref:BTB domain-containing protein n=1 Tax=Cytospora leucostoma TaxID=1230097 RepID=A0A423VNK9_9PEZI|nr:hypothetical protein VPNG_09865 [Cytospora leucostoma]
MSDQSGLQDTTVSLNNDNMSTSGKAGRYGPLYAPVPIVAITVKGGQTFHLHKHVLTKDSLYFDRALNGLFTEAQGQTIDLDDIEAEAFGLYVSLVYPTALSEQEVSLCNVWQGPGKYAWLDLLRLWQLADRFLNAKIKRIANEELDKRFSKLSVDAWLHRYQVRTWPYIKATVSDLNCAFRVCVDENLPYEDAFIIGLSNCPPQVFAECAEGLDSDFLSPVAKLFAIRMASPTLTARKRQMDEMREAKGLTVPSGNAKVTNVDVAFARHAWDHFADAGL